MNDVFGKVVFDVSKLDDFNTAVVNKTVIIQTTDEMEQGSGFTLKDIGLVTSYHVTQNDGFYNVLSNQGNKIDFFTKSDNEIYSDEKIDYAIYRIKEENCNGLKLGNSEELEIGDKVTLVGYPNYQCGDSPNIQTAHISSKKNLFGSDLYTVDKSIFHGASGGVVVNEQNEVVGIIKGGVESCDESQTNVNQGFVPIHLVVSDIKEKQK